jgi:uroporphyrinogen-III decarboxylase
VRVTAKVSGWPGGTVVNSNELISAALRGAPVDRVPWTIYANLLPRGATERDLRNRGLALLSHASVYTVKRPNVTTDERTVADGDETIVVRTLRTPVGDLTERRRVEPGYGSSWAYEHFVKQPGDYEILEFIIRDTSYVPDPTVWQAKRDEIGTDGIVNTGVHRIPFQRLWIEYAGLDRFLFDLHDYPELVGRAIEAMNQKDRELWSIIADSPVEFVWCPDNVTALAIGPRLFDQYFAPYYRDLCAVMHGRGKRVYAHVDGAARAIAENIARTPIDIVEAFTPEPTGDLSLAEARRVWKNKIIWINFPSSVHIQAADEVAAVARDLLRQAGTGEGFLFGVTENVPDHALAASLTAITDVLEENGRLPLTH